MSHKRAKKDRRAGRSAVAGARNSLELMAHLREQLAFIAGSAASFDAGFDGEAKRLALTVRVLVHDTSVSPSLLTQLGIKGTLRFVDTAVPVLPQNLLTTLGLVMIEGSEFGAKYVAPLANGPPGRYGRTKVFDRWWTEPVSVLDDRSTVTRQDYVLAAANREGGGHVDPNLEPLFERFKKDNPFGWVWEGAGKAAQPLAGHGALASIRQIAYEITETLTQLVPR